MAAAATACVATTASTCISSKMVRPSKSLKRTPVAASCESPMSSKNQEIESVMIRAVDQRLSQLVEVQSGSQSSQSVIGSHIPIYRWELYLQQLQQELFVFCSSKPSHLWYFLPILVSHVFTLGCPALFLCTKLHDSAKEFLNDCLISVQPILIFLYVVKVLRNFDCTHSRAIY